MATVRLENVDKAYDKSPAVITGLNLDIKDGEFLVLVGPSGCGKSTTLRMVAGLEEVTHGRIFIGDRDVTHIPPKDRDIAMVFQNYALYPHMKVYDNIAFGLKLRKYPKDEIEKRVREAAEILELTDFLDRKPKHLSGGQRQRVALGRAIVRKPQVFLFDEPLSNLDAKLRVQMRAEIKKLHQRLKTTVIYVTHDQVEAMTMGDRIVVMKDGAIHQVDNPLNLYQNPADTFVASFIGSPPMNIFRMKYRPGEPVHLLMDRHDIEVHGVAVEKLRNVNSDEIVVGIRPDQFSLKPVEGFSRITGNLRLVEPMGSELFLYLSLGDNQIICKTSTMKEYPLNTEMELYFDPRRIHFFHPETGKRVA